MGLKMPSDAIESCRGMGLEMPSGNGLKDAIWWLLIGGWAYRCHLKVIVELYVTGEWTSIRKASMLWNISELVIWISNRLTPVFGESVNCFQKSWIWSLLILILKKGKVVAETRSHVAWNAWCNVCYINVYDMNVMNAYVSWWAVLLRIDESWTAEDKRILTTAGENNSLIAAG